MYRDLCTCRLYLFVLLYAVAVLETALADDVEIDFSLIDHEGKTFHLHDLRGKLVLVFFGYTLCPDVCPIELQYMAGALQRPSNDAKYVRGLFITVDPEHDRPEVLRQYMEYFGGGMVGLAGTKQQIDRAAQQFKVTFRKNSRSVNQYTMDHTANLFGINQAGALSTIVPFGFPAAHIESLLREMVAAEK